METEVKSVHYGSGFIKLEILIDGIIYEGILFSKGGQNEKTTQNLVNSGREDGEI
jgi:hypothetical protein